MTRFVEKATSVYAPFQAIENQHHRALALQRRYRLGNESLEPAMESALLAAGAAAVIAAIVTMLTRWLKKGSGGGASYSDSKVVAAIADTAPAVIAQNKDVLGILHDINVDINVSNKDGKHTFVQPTDRAGKPMKLDAFLFHRITERLQAVHYVITGGEATAYFADEAEKMATGDVVENLKTLVEYLDQLEKAAAEKADPSTLDEIHAKVQVVVDESKARSDKLRDIIERSREILDDESKLNGFHTASQLIEASQKSMMTIRLIADKTAKQSEGRQHLYREMTDMLTRCEKLKERLDWDKDGVYSKHSLVLGSMIQSIIQGVEMNARIVERIAKTMRRCMEVIETSLLVIGGMKDKQAVNESDTAKIQAAAIEIKAPLEEVRKNMGKVAGNN